MSKNRCSRNLKKKVRLTHFRLCLLETQVHCNALHCTALTCNVLHCTVLVPHSSIPGSAKPVTFASPHPGLQAIDHFKKYFFCFWNSTAKKLCLIKSNNICVSKQGLFERCTQNGDRNLLNASIQLHMTLLKIRFQFQKVPHMGNTWPSHTCVIQEYQFYTMSSSQCHECCQYHKYTKLKKYNLQKSRNIMT